MYIPKLVLTRINLGNTSPIKVLMLTLVLYIKVESIDMIEDDKKMFKTFNFSYNDTFNA